jgi:hypothetical protein
MSSSWGEGSIHFHEKANPSRDYPRIIQDKGYSITFCPFSHRGLDWILTEIINSMMQKFSGLRIKPCCLSFLMEEARPFINFLFFT